MPTTSAIALMSNGKLKPCQMDKWYSGSGLPANAVAATSTSGPSVSAGNTPTTMHSVTSSMAGSFMPSGGSCGWVLGTSPSGPLKYVSCTKRSEYATLQTPAKVTSAGTSQANAPEVPTTASVKNISLDKKPLVKGTPAMDAAATMDSVAVQGMSDHRPPSLRMSREWVSWSTMPAIMNSEALKVAWLSTWNTAATAASGEPKPTKKVIRPKWLTVE